MRQIVLDTETTGMNPLEGHRIIEIGCLELENRRLTGRSFHYYLKPDRPVDPEAVAVHGITDEFLQDKPKFEEVAAEFEAFVRGSELIIHNAAFDVGFLDHEMRRLSPGFSTIRSFCDVLDTLTLARQKHPGQKNSLDALAKRYFVDHRQRTYHGALLDAEILADVYLAMTGGQVGLSLQDDSEAGDGARETVRRLPADRPRLRVIAASPEESAAHAARLDIIDKSCGGTCIWREEGLA
ncbi:DNA polymerase-3 subunit epsilon [Fluviicoccus keumensis]|uniref:DNA polymerase III subunit epsilon n=1 Tax=Fluviicoccus keumensis TaxID=1435465 RepID=A0A4Q7YI37_9GAMM|nr:DNA polymerase III subunit epsilon [Fluviicoccus keumensis]RZU37097.1 DNA polymerase-3 subunit epsilon [Fluviicoccus keumensis]